MEASRVLMEYKKVWKSFPGVIALQDVSFDLHDGEVLAICGENGAGKSTIIKLAGGIYPAGSYAGHIVLDGQHTEFRSVRDSEMAGIAIIHQELALCPNLSIADNIFLGQEIARVSQDMQKSPSAEPRKASAPAAQAHTSAAE